MILEKYDLESIRDYLKEFITHVDDQSPEIGMIFITVQHEGDTVYVHSNLDKKIRAKIIMELAKEDLSESQDFQQFSKQLNKLLDN